MDGNSQNERESERKPLTNRSKKRQFKSVIKDQPQTSQLPTIERHLQQSQTFMKTLKMKQDVNQDFLLQGNYHIHP